MSLTMENAGIPWDEDIRLVERVLAGDSNAFGELYSKYYCRVHGIARGILNDADEAADAAQEVFTLAYRNLHKFDRKAKFSTWLFRIAVNGSIQQARRGKFRQRLRPLDEAQGAIEEAKPVSNDGRVDFALSKLSPQDRALIALFYWEEMSLQDIADSMGCRTNAAKTALYRARLRFRKFYEEAPE